jgi:hypothetical protein
VFQTTAFLTPMLALIRHWTALAWCAAIMLSAFASMYAIWLRRIKESDVLAADARALLDSESG